MVFQTREDASQGASLDHLVVWARAVLAHIQALLPRMLTSFPNQPKVVDCLRVHFHRNPALQPAGRCQSLRPIVRTLSQWMSHQNRTRKQAGACLRAENEVRRWARLPPERPGARSPAHPKRRRSMSLKISMSCLGHHADHAMQGIRRLLPGVGSAPEVVSLGLPTSSLFRLGGRRSDHAASFSRRSSPFSCWLPAQRGQLLL